MVDDLDGLASAISRAIELSGARASHTGVFITGRLHFEGPTFVNQLFREHRDVVEKVDQNLAPSDDEATRKYVWILRELEVVEDVTEALLAEGAITSDQVSVMDIDPKSELPQDQFHRSFYDVTPGVSMEWIHADRERIVTALRGLGGSDGLFDAVDRPNPAPVPERILRPFAVYRAGPS